MKDNNRIIYLDFLRIIACIAVICIHVSDNVFLFEDINTVSWIISVFYNGISRWAVPIFVMISGVLFLDPNKKIDMKKVYKKNILKLVFAFLFWSVIYTFFTYQISRNKNMSLSQIVILFVEGKYHLWYIYMLIGIYILIPFFRKIVEDENLTKYFLGLSIIFTYIFPMVLKIPKISAFETAYNNMRFFFTLGYSSYFVLGYYLNNIQITKKYRKIIYLCGIVGIIMTIVGTSIVSKFNNEPYRFILSELTFNIFLESVAVFVFAKYEFSNILKNQKINKIILKLSKNTFGIYLVHVLVLDSLFKLKIDINICRPALSIPILVLMIFIISNLITKLLGKIPKLNEYIV